MIYIAQLIYIKEGQEEVFNRFEAVAIPLISKYKGQLLLRIRPTENTFIEEQMERPYEIHFIEFDTEHNFQSFMKDEERKNVLHLKEQSIKTVLLVKGEKL